MAETITDHKAQIRGLIDDAINAHDAEEVDEFVTEDLTVRGATDHDSAEEFKNFLKGVNGAFPDVAFDIQRIVVEGDTAAFRVTVTGTHQGEFEELPPTGNEVEYTSSFFCTFREGKISEMVYDSDRVSMLEDLGVMS